MSKKPETMPDRPQGELINLAHLDLVAAIGEIGNIAPNKVLKTNQFTSKYISLDVVLDNVKPILAKHNLALFQHYVSEPGMIGVATKIIHTSGHVFDYDRIMLRADRPAKDKEGNTIVVPLTTQEIGSQTNYIRRQAICCAMALAVDTDDDGAAASRTTAPGVKAPIPASSTELPGLNLSPEDTAKAITYCQRKGWITEGQTLTDLPNAKLAAIHEQFPAFLAAIRK